MRSPREMSTLKPDNAGRWVREGLEIIVFMMKSPETKEPGWPLWRPTGLVGEEWVTSPSGWHRDASDCESPLSGPPATATPQTARLLLLRLGNHRFRAGI
ncbi:hypothetical protein AGR7B_pAt0121 [Agrobacterium deltaense RV3]|nr:hypothetical protein AGR7B_pAt0121 [Agrobacterium deltaense RV3]